MPVSREPPSISDLPTDIIERVETKQPLDWDSESWSLAAPDFGG